jgi:hypothetical protein
MQRTGPVQRAEKKRASGKEALFPLFAVSKVDVRRFTGI